MPKHYCINISTEIKSGYSDYPKSGFTRPFWDPNTRYPKSGKRMSDEHYFKAFFGSFLQRNAKKLILGPHYVSPSCTSFIGTIKIHQHFNDWKNFAFQ